jgi:hypothetical protein
MDGVTPSASYRVRVIEIDGSERVFCGVRCAQAWLAREARAPGAILVTDCGSGREIPADSDCFVRTVSTWGEGAPDAICAFATGAGARRHVEAHGGVILEGADRPFGAGRR